MADNEITQYDEIKSRIYVLRGLQVMLDKDLAQLYGVQTKVLNQAEKGILKDFQ